MSVLMMARMFRLELGNASRKIMAVRLADFADDEGRGVWPTWRGLSRETELSERTVQRILSDFVREGLLVVVQEPRAGPGRRRATTSTWGWCGTWRPRRRSWRRPADG